MPEGCRILDLGRVKMLLCDGNLLDNIFPAIWRWNKDFTEIYINCNLGIVASDATSHLDASLFVDNSALKELTIKKCAISSIAPGTFAGFENLVMLYLDSAYLKVIENNAFKGLQNLKTLTLRPVGTETYPGGILTLNSALRDAYNLEKLFLFGNKRLAYFPRGVNSTSFLTGLTNLEDLDIGDTGLGLGNIPTDSDVLASFFKDQADTLTVLNLHDNALGNRHLHMLKYFKRLEILGFKNNRLSFIEADSLPRVANGRVFLQSNDITFIDVDVFSHLVNVTLYVNDNPFTCDCNNEGFSKWIRDGNASENGNSIPGAHLFKCSGSQGMHGTKLKDYDPCWWDCNQYVPLVALVFTVSFALIVATVAIFIYCNWVNIRHWILERREAAKPQEFDEPEDRRTRGMARRGGIEMNSLRQGKTGAFVIYNLYQQHVLSWANRYLDENLHLHPLKITLQWPAGPEVWPLWQQVKDFSFQVNFFLVLVNDDFLANHWPGIAENSGDYNILKLVFVLFEKKKSDLPKELKALKCPCIVWPEARTKFMNLERCRDLFWKELRLWLKRSSQ
jgi:hypothetical protein